MPSPYPCRSRQEGARPSSHLLTSFNGSTVWRLWLISYPAWIRTRTKGAKVPCATVTPPGIKSCLFVLMSISFFVTLGSCPLVHAPLLLFTRHVSQLSRPGTLTSSKRRKGYIRRSFYHLWCLWQAKSIGRAEQASGE